LSSFLGRRETEGCPGQNDLLHNQRTRTCTTGVTTAHREDQSWAMWPESSDCRILRLKETLVCTGKQCEFGGTGHSADWASLLWSLPVNFH
jgi:hypothetical protein